MSILSALFGQGGNKEELRSFIKQGAIIIDVRSHSEFQGGHVAGSKNIPLSEVKSQLPFIKKLNKPVILCCASGGRSGQATAYLKQEGIPCVNGGSWTQVNALV